MDKRELASLREIAIEIKNEDASLSSSMIATAIRRDHGKKVTADQVQKWLQPHFGIKAKRVRVKLPKPLVLRGDALVMGDVHSPALDWKLIDKAFEEADNKNITTLDLAGDLTMMDDYSKYPQTYKNPSLSFDAQMEGLERFFYDAFEVFKTVNVMMGNHDERLTAATYGDIDLRRMIKMVIPDGKMSKVNITPNNYAFRISGKERWLVSHCYKYSKNPLAVANALAYIYGCHVIHHHQHICAAGRSADGRYTLIDNGCMSHQSSMPYARLRLSTMRPFEEGYTFLIGGRAYPYADGSLWGGF